MCGCPLQTGGGARLPDGAHVGRVGEIPVVEDQPSWVIGRGVAAGRVAAQRERRRLARFVLLSTALTIMQLDKHAESLAHSSNAEILGCNCDMPVADTADDDAGARRSTRRVGVPIGATQAAAMEFLGLLLRAIVGVYGVV